MDAYINMRGMKTLAVRIDEQLKNKNDITNTLIENQIEFSTTDNVCCILLKCKKD